MPDVDSKECLRCQKDLPFGDFSKCKAGKFGLQGWCRACCREYREENKDSIVAKQRARYLKNRDQVIARVGEYRAERRDKFIAYGKEYREANKDHLEAKRRKYYEVNKEEIAAYRRAKYKANPRKFLDGNHRWRARVRESSAVKFSEESLLQRMAYFGNKCYMCGGPFEHVDHVKPLSKGGPHMLSNLRPACGSCNCSKGSKWPLPSLGEA